SENEVQNTGRDARGFEDLRDPDRSCGRDRRGFENDCVSCNESRRNLPNRNRDRKIPGRHTRDHAEWLFDRVGEVQRQLGGNGLAIHASRLARTKLSDIDRTLQLTARLRDRLAFFVCEKLCELFFVLLQQARGFGDDATTGGSRCRPPTAKRGGGCFNSRARFFASRLPDGAEDVVGVGWVDVLSSACGGGFQPFAADKIAISVHIRARNIS